MAGLLPVSDALARICASIPAGRASETIAVTDGLGRTLAAPIIAVRTQPPFRASAMDGYAVRAADLTGLTPLTVIGESAAGHGFHDPVGPGQAVRIFTGAPLPPGTDTILVQENATRTGATITPTQTEAEGRFVRPAGADFSEGQSYFATGHRLRARDMTLAASLGLSTISVMSAPRVAVLATGDELVLPGTLPGPDQIVAANHLTIMGLAAQAGATTRFLGIAPDDNTALDTAIRAARDWKADILVTLGGASVGDHDLVQGALLRAGLTLDFWKIAMRPGKPLMFGGLDDMRVLGLPGNPASAIVCAHLFLKPLIAAWLGQPGAAEEKTRHGRLAVDLPENDMRQEYMRATLGEGADGIPLLAPFKRQDSSLTHVLVEADALVVRPPHAPAAKAGDTCRYIALGDG
jgi:molybdopterin molybdotransferase